MLDDGRRACSCFLESRNDLIVDRCACGEPALLVTALNDADRKRMNSSEIECQLIAANRQRAGAEGFYSRLDAVVLEE